MTTADQQYVLQELKAFIAREANFGSDTDIPEDVDIFGQGIVDSLMAVSLVAFCQDTFQRNIGIERFGENGARTLRDLAILISTDHS